MPLQPQIASPGSASERPPLVSPRSIIHRRRMRVALEQEREDDPFDDEDADWDDFEPAESEPESPWDAWDPLDDEPAEPDQRDFWPDPPDDDD